MTTNQLIMLLAIYRGTYADQPTPVGTHVDDLQLLKTRGLVEVVDRVPCMTEDGNTLVRDLLQQAGNSTMPTSRLSLPSLGAHPIIPDAKQLLGSESIYMVANGLCRQQDIRPEPALVMPPLSVYGSLASANSRAIELAVHARGTHFFVLKSVSMYNVDKVEPKRTY